MDTLLRDLRHGVRMLRRTPGFTAVAIAVLALSIGVNTAVFSLVNTVILQPRPGRIDQLHAVFTRDRTQQDRGYRDFSYPAYRDLKARTDIFDSLMAHTFSTVGITDRGLDDGDGATRQTFAAIVSSNYFSTLGVSLAAGRAFTPDEERPGANARVAVASYAAWRRTGFDPAFVGRTIRASGADYTIIGVAPRGFAGTMTLVSPEWWFPLGCYDTIVNEMFKTRTTGLTDRGNYPLNVAGLLREGVSEAAADAALDTLGRQLSDAYPDSDKNQIFTLGPLPRMSVSSQPQGKDPFFAVTGLLMLMAGLVLVVACLNLANMLLARGAARRKEIAIRQALGSGRTRIIRQLLVEGLTLSMVGAAFGVVLGWWTSSALTAWLSSVMPLGIELVAEPSSRLLVAAAGFALFSTACFALGPAWSLSRPTVSGDLKGDYAMTSAAGRARRRLGTGSVLVVGQLAVSLALVAAGGLFVRGGINAARADAGFAVDRHVLVSLDASLAGYDAARTAQVYRDALARVRALPAVEHASVGAIVPFGEFQEGRGVRLKPDDKAVNAEFNIVGAQYFATLGVPVLRGREFTAAEEEPGSSAASAIVDRPLAARLFPSADPLGQQILLQGREGEPSRTYSIVGVVGETKHDLFDGDDLKHVYVSSGSLFRSMMTIHARTAPGASEAAVLGTIRRELRALDPRLPVLSMKTMADHRYRSISEWSVRAAATMFATLGGLALLLATLGVYGLRAYDVSRRTRELGIRIALGATAADVARLVLGDGARTSAVGLGIGLLLAAGIGKLASGLLYGVSPFDPLVLSVAFSVLAIASMAAAYVPARRAMRIAPLDALRTE
jgi:putative ABC transport system permease protein